MAWGFNPDSCHHGNALGECSVCMQELVRERRTAASTADSKPAYEGSSPSAPAKKSWDEYMRTEGWREYHTAPCPMLDGDGDVCTCGKESMNGVCCR